MEGFSEKEARVFADVICLNVLKNIKALVVAADKFGIDVGEEHKPIADDLRNLTIQLSDVELTEDRSAGIQALWKDPGVHEVLERANEFQFDDSAVYFFDNLTFGRL